MMQRLTVLVGIILVAIGAASYFGAAPTRGNPLAIAGTGSVLIACGWAAMNERVRMHAMHGAVLAGLIGMVVGIVGVLQGDAVVDSAGAATPSGTNRWPASVTALVCGVYVVLCVRSFVMARRARAMQGGA
ncbi:MAG: hypothetical protein HBSAPP02_26800 [Phycisphaerae bacterium]|nr:MAG: hypothetical protein HRU71_01690 [Planctomycetia bacterium]RIK71058.1 MAG: hypothetical protein DCC66_02480 [Planctomycetota bacterium]GJQ27648.1 MAG: hypothetical protein HBSAPP02_26800 [Phycisphaerae bacterium]